MNKNHPDIVKIFGIKDFIDKRESEANCLLCFTTFPLHDIEEHIASEYHKILHKVTTEIDNPNLVHKVTTEIDTPNLVHNVTPEIANPNLVHNVTTEIDNPNLVHNVTTEIDNPNVVHKVTTEIDTPNLVHKVTPEIANPNLVHKVTTEIVNPNLVHKVTTEIDNLNLGSSSSNKTSQNAKKFSGKENAPPIRRDKANKLDKKSNKDKTIPEKILYERYMKSCAVVRVDLLFGYVLNERIFIEFSCFNLYEVLKDDLYCFKCDVNCCQQHLLDAHSDDDCMSAIVVNIDNEFIREIKWNKFHCGHCNVVKLGWEKMKKHLNSKTHGRMREYSIKMTYLIEHNIGDTEVIDRINGLSMFRDVQNLVLG